MTPRCHVVALRDGVKVVDRGPGSPARTPEHTPNTHLNSDVHTKSMCTEQSHRRRHDRHGRHGRHRRRPQDTISWWFPGQRRKRSQLCSTGPSLNTHTHTSVHCVKYSVSLFLSLPSPPPPSSLLPLSLSPPSPLLPFSPPPWMYCCWF